MQKRARGELKFAEDENFKRTFEIANEIYEKGYVNEDYASPQDALTRFLQGKAAMYGGDHQLSGSHRPGMCLGRTMWASTQRLILTQM